MLKPRETFCILAMLALAGCSGGKTPTTVKTTAHIGMQCDASNQSDSPPAVKISYRFVVDGQEFPKPPAAPLTKQIDTDKEQSIPVQRPPGAKPKKLEWEVESIQRIDNTEICHCGCCAEEGKTCKDSDPTKWNKPRTLQDDSQDPFQPDNTELDVSCRCQ